MTRASAVFRDMCTAGMVPDLITYSTVIKGYCVAGELEQAIQLFTLMRKRGIQPDQVLFNSILDGCARKNMTMVSEQIFADMQASSVAPSNTTLTILVKTHGAAGDLDTALQLAQDLPKKYGFEPNNQVLTCLVQACLSNNRIKTAFEVFDRMASPDAKAYATLASGCLKHHDLEGSLGALDLAISRGVHLDQELVDGVLQVARRRAGDKVAPFVARLAAAGYSVGCSQ